MRTSARVTAETITELCFNIEMEKQQSLSLGVLFQRQYAPPHTLPCLELAKMIADASFNVEVRIRNRFGKLPWLLTSKSTCDM